MNSCVYDMRLSLCVCVCVCVCVYHACVNIYMAADKENAERCQANLSQVLTLLALLVQKYKY